MFANPPMEKICALLRQTHTIAVVGLSPNPTRPSHRIARGLQSRGFRVIPVRPLVETILDEKAYARLAEVQAPIDLVNIFRTARELDPIIDDCLALGLPRIWIQEGIVNDRAAERALAGGIEVVMNRCIWRDLNGGCA